MLRIMTDASSILPALAIATIATTVIVLVRYLIVSGFFAWCTKVRRPGLYAGQGDQIRSEIGWSAASAAIYGVPAGLMLYAWDQLGWTRITSDPLALPLWYWPVSVLIYLFLHDTWFYWTHRLMHRPALYRAAHYVHHQSHPPTAWAAMSFHPWEALSGAVLIPALAFVIPIHISALAVVMAVASFFGVTNHMGWEIFPRWLVNGPLGRHLITASHHEQHHRRNKCNYGLYFRFWDQVCGTDRGLCGFDRADRHAVNRTDADSRPIG
jgi:Delta7-sterol 5-desaturase